MGSWLILFCVQRTNLQSACLSISITRSTGSRSDMIIKVQPALRIPSTPMGRFMPLFIQRATRSPFLAPSLRRDADNMDDNRLISEYRRIVDPQTTAIFSLCTNEARSQRSSMFVLDTILIKNFDRNSPKMGTHGHLWVRARELKLTELGKSWDLPTLYADAYGVGRSQQLIFIHNFLDLSLEFGALVILSGEHFKDFCLGLPVGFSPDKCVINFLANFRI